MKLSPEQLARMIDASAVQAQSCLDDVKETAAVAKKYQCICAFSLPSFTPVLAEELKENGTRNVLLGGVVGFPSGGDSTATKVDQGKELIALGCDEIDMVMNVGKMRSGLVREVAADIAAVKEAIGAIPLKVILECHHLTEKQIAEASVIAVDAGASWVKTGTGWAPTGATLENVKIIKEAIGDRARIKAAGGVRTLDTIEKMVDLGVERFGIGCRTVKSLFEAF
ncbi:MAG: deoxyribose-phosphate aldolase [Thermoguttaceae bacterium]|jgi:deoxyribose-phosphate aldolase